MQGRVPSSGLCTFQVVAKNGNWTEGPGKPCFLQSWLFLCPSPSSSPFKASSETFLVTLSQGPSVFNPGSASPRVCLLPLAILDRSLDQEVVSVSALAVLSLKVSWSVLSGSRV